jgi:hypothetical protein
MKKINNYMKAFVCLIVLGMAISSASAQESYALKVWKAGVITHAIPTSDVDSVTINPFIPETEILGRDITTDPVTYIWQQYGCDNGTDDDQFLNMGDMKHWSSWLPSDRPFYVVHNGARVVESNWASFWNPMNNFEYLAGVTLPVERTNYFTIDMGRKATYTRMMMLIPARGTGNTPIPVEFVVWGANSVKQANEIGDGSRAANLEYWTSWEAVNGGDDWKKDWVQLANNTCSKDDAEQWANGYNFNMDPSVTDAYRYLRFEIKQLSLANQNSIMIDELQFWGYYEE